MDTRYSPLDTGKYFSLNKYPASSIRHQVSGHFSYLFFLIIFIILTLILNVNYHALESDFEGQLSGWFIESDINNRWEDSAGFRYIPDIDISHQLENDTAIDSEISLNMFSSTGSGPYVDDTDIDLYRADIRYTTTRTETRLGLQKINFGPGVILRPLKWFDRLDPTDPLQLTDGVYALRFRYVSPDNSSFWAWFLYGNDDPKGYEIFPSTSDDIEAGGRIQSPVLSGDVGFTFHTRIVDSTSFNIPEFRENRYAVDGRWDMGIGLWFESVFQEQKSDYLPYRWTKRISAGADSTFDIGSGLYLLTEHMVTAASEKMLKWQNDYHISAFQMSYSVGILDRVSAIGYYLWDQEKFSQYISWTRTYDNFLINLSLFYYPETSLEINGQAQGTVMGGRIIGGRGIQIMVIFNH